MRLTLCECSDAESPARSERVITKTILRSSVGAWVSEERAKFWILLTGKPELSPHSRLGSSCTSFKHLSRKLFMHMPTDSGPETDGIDTKPMLSGRSSRWSESSSIVDGVLVLATSQAPLEFEVEQKDEAKHRAAGALKALQNRIDPFSMPAGTLCMMRTAFDRVENVATECLCEA
eukprot:CAMPEP_0169171744 /NCGR_PEP_ID=MMETSP1015-20121227/62911_1 /TAXON_ID=342587 /ORGANISM="Karlodinium micrum, Strain CCMP2283" /LENGTH=175 /DNA_ID=CAMNT_0009245027 /DNA_START=432 /DNA_END=954 /DNA_ORIENTATION=+